MNRRIAYISGGSVAVVGAVTLGLVLATRGETAEAKTDAQTATTTITRRDVSDTQTLDGSLGFADTRPAVNSAAGTYTWLPKEGRRVKPGEVLYRVDDKPVVLLSGSIPMYRSLQAGVSDGEDVRQVEQTLRDLDYDEGNRMTVDDHWDSRTTDAVQRLQDEVGLSQTGVLTSADTIVLPGERRIQSVEGQLGGRAAPGRPALITTSVTREATFALDTRLADVARPGVGLTIELPGGEKVPGKVTEVDAVARKSSPDSNTATVTVRAQVGRGAEGLDQAPVEVVVKTKTAKRALAVPVSALLALRGGGTGVEIVDGASSRIVEVDTGATSDGYVAVEGDGIAEGAKVVTAR